MNSKNWTLILDFDSTIITSESLDTLSEIVLKNNINSKSIVKEIKRITNEGMEGIMSFEDSLKKRLKLLKIKSYHLNELKETLLNMISPSFDNNFLWLKENADNIFIFSGGFKNVIIPVAKQLGLRTQNIYANDLIFFNNGNFKEIDDSNLLCKSNGKLLQAKLLDIKSQIIMVGDGITDQEMKKLGKNVTFFCFIENIYRDKVVDKADFLAEKFDDVITYIEKLN